MRTLLLILLLVPMMSFGQNVYIPDANFKSYLVNNTAINTNGDSEIQVSEASTYTGTNMNGIDCPLQNISDLTGIEAFTALTRLVCWGNNLTSLDVSNNTALTLLDCGENQLASLDVSSNTALTYLICDTNNLTSLDVSNNTALTTLVSVWNNSLNCLNLKSGNNTTLISVEITPHPSLYCIEVDNVTYSTNAWFISPWASFSENCNNDCSSSLDITELNNTPKQLIKIVDLLGREAPFKPNTTLLYIYDDGTVERKMIIE
jgi:hypothetical protein